MTPTPTAEPLSRVSEPRLKKCKTLPFKPQCDELTQPDIKHSVRDSIRMFCKIWNASWMAMFCLLAALQRSELSRISIGKNHPPPPACRWNQTGIPETCRGTFLYVCPVRVKWRRLEIRETLMWVFYLRSQSQSGMQSGWECCNLGAFILVFALHLGLVPQLAKQRHHSDAVDKHCNRCLYLRPFGVFHTWLQLHLGFFSPSQINMRLMSKAIAFATAIINSNTWRR